VAGFDLAERATVLGAGRASGASRLVDAERSFNRLAWRSTLRFVAAVARGVVALAVLLGRSTRAEARAPLFSFVPFTAFDAPLPAVACPRRPASRDDAATLGPGSRFAAAERSTSF